MTSIKEVRNFPGYFITKCGEVYSNKFGELKPLKASTNTHGYLSVRFSLNGKKKHKTVHRLVAEAFLKKTADCVNHIDGNQLNNCVNNLEWCSDLENKMHSKEMGLMSSGDKHWNIKLTSEKLQLAKELKAQGFSGRKIAKLFGLNQYTVNKRLAGG